MPPNTPIDVKKHGLQSARPRIGNSIGLREVEGADALTSLGRYDSLKSLPQSSINDTKYVNLQTLIDREITMGKLLRNFSKGESITELSIELWFLINEVDIAKPQEGEENGIS